MPKITVTRDHLRELQKVYHLCAKDKNKVCVAEWIHRLAAHLQVDVQVDDYPLKRKSLSTTESSQTTTELAYVECVHEETELEYEE